MCPPNPAQCGLRAAFLLLRTLKLPRAVREDPRCDPQFPQAIGLGRLTSPPDNANVRICRDPLDHTDVRIRRNLAPRFRSCSPTASRQRFEARSSSPATPGASDPPHRLGDEVCFVLDHDDLATLSDVRILEQSGNLREVPRPGAGEDRRRRPHMPRGPEDRVDCPTPAGPRFRARSQAGGSRCYRSAGRGVPEWRSWSTPHPWGWFGSD